MMDNIRVVTNGTIFPASLKELAAQKGTLIVDGPIGLGGSVVIPDTLQVVVTASGSIDLLGHDLTFNAPLDAHVHAIFRNSSNMGQVLFLETSTQAEVWAEWWGASPEALPSTNSAAFAAACLALAGGGTVRLGPGTFRMTGTLAVPDGCRLRGAGMGETTLGTDVAASAGSFRPVILCSGVLNVQDMTFSAAGLAPGVLPTCAVRGGYRVELRRVRFDGFDVAVSLADVDEAEVDRCRFVRNKVGLALDNVRDVRVVDCEFVHALAPDTTGVEVGGAGTGEERRCVNVLVRDCVFQGAGAITNTTGVRVLNGRLVQVRDCRFERLAAGVTFATDSVDGIGADVGRCRFVHCGAAVDPGNVSARVRVQGRGGSATLAFLRATPPDESSWQRGDRIDNSEPKPGEPVGWVCSGTDPTTGRKRWWSWARVGPSAPAKT